VPATCSQRRWRSGALGASDQRPAASGGERDRPCGGRERRGSATCTRTTTSDDAPDAQSVAIVDDGAEEPDGESACRPDRGAARRASRAEVGLTVEPKLDSLRLTAPSIGRVPLMSADEEG